jgi:hypothetical protein
MIGRRGSSPLRQARGRIAIVSEPPLPPPAVCFFFNASRNAISRATSAGSSR